MYLPVLYIKRIYSIFNAVAVLEQTLGSSEQWHLGTTGSVSFGRNQECVQKLHVQLR